MIHIILLLDTTSKSVKTALDISAQTFIKYGCWKTPFPASAHVYITDIVYIWQLQASYARSYKPYVTVTAGSERNTSQSLQLLKEIHHSQCRLWKGYITVIAGFERCCSSTSPFAPRAGTARPLTQNLKTTAWQDSAHVQTLAQAYRTLYEVDGATGRHTYRHTSI